LKSNIENGIEPLVKFEIGYLMSEQNTQFKERAQDMNSTLRLKTTDSKNLQKSTQMVSYLIGSNNTLIVGYLNQQS
jgi:hypothetical protein